VFLLVSYIFLFGIDEPPSKITGNEKTSFTNYIQSIPIVFKKPGFSILMLTNISLRFLFLALPFYVVFGEKVLLFSKEMIGYFVSAQTLGYVASSRLWGYLSDNLSNKSVITGTCISAIVAPICALSVYGMKLMDLKVLLFPMYLLLFLAIGFTISGLWIGFNNLILEISDDQTRPTYIGIYNTLSAPMTFFPILGGKIIEMSSYIHLFVITVFFLVLALISSLYIKEPYRTQNGLQ
jgi:MFS family permease